MAADNWRSQIRHIQDGEPVDAEHGGRPDRDLDARTLYLLDRINATSSGEALVAKGVPVKGDVAVGRAVYANPTTQQFEHALATITTDPDTGSTIPSPTCNVVGIVIAKTGLVADILLGGRYELDLSMAVEDDVLPGRYYLSPGRPGFLTLTMPPASIYVLSYDGTFVYVQPQFRNFLQDHVHYRFDLAARPAGTTSSPGAGNIHTIASPDTSQRGWLPASHSIFNHKAPVGAAFGYNLSADPTLNRAFPPQPPDQAQIIWDKGVDYTGGTFVPMGTSGLAVVDQYGIWWMSDTYGDVPWPKDWPTGSTLLDPNTSAGPENPRDVEMRVQMVFSAMLYQTSDTVVKSLQAAPNSVVTVTNCDGTASTTGALQIDVDMQHLLALSSSADGSEVLKHFDSSGRLVRGYVCEGIIADANSPGLTILSTRRETLNPGQLDEAVLHQGICTIAFDPDPSGRELMPQVIQLREAVEQDYLDILYIGFPYNRLSAIRARFQVPTIGTPADPTITFRACLLARATGTLPAMTMTYRIVPRSGDIPAALPGLGAEVDAPFNPSQPMLLNTYVEAESSAIAVAAGDTVFCTLTREAGDGYVGEVGLIRIAAILAGS